MGIELTGKTGRVGNGFKTGIGTVTSGIFEGCTAASECNDGTHNCAHATADCEELDYGYQCKCITGYEGKSYTDVSWQTGSGLSKQLSDKL